MEPGTKVMIEAVVLETGEHYAIIKTANNFKYAIRPSDLTVCEKAEEIDINNFCIDITNPVNAELLPRFKEWYRKNCNWDDPTPNFNEKHYGVMDGDFSCWDSLHKPPVCTLPELQKQHPGVFETQQLDQSSTPSFKAGQEPNVDILYEINSNGRWIPAKYGCKAPASYGEDHHVLFTGKSESIEVVHGKNMRLYPAQPTVESELMSIINDRLVNSNCDESGLGSKRHYTLKDSKIDIYNAILAWHQKHSGRVEVSVPSDDKIEYRYEYYSERNGGNVLDAVIKTVRHFMTRKEQQG